MSGVRGRIQRPRTPNHRPTIGGRAAMADAHSTSPIPCRLCGVPFHREDRDFCRDCYNKRRKAQRDVPEVRARMRAERRANWPQRRATHKRSAPKILPHHIRMQSPKYRAHIKVNAAIKSGRLIRPSQCSECGVVPTRAVEGHHEDYSKVYEVIWLCRACHKKRHWK